MAPVVCIAAGMLAGTASGEPKPDPRKLAPAAITIEAGAIASFDRLGGTSERSGQRFGKLAFLGGLVLTAPGSANFGGWSGLIVGDDGREFAAVSDSGVWLTGTIRYDKDRPAAIENARLGPLLARDGNPFKRNRDRDAEAVALVSGTLRGGSVLIAFEQNSRLARYELTSGGFSRALQFLDLPSGARGMRRNNGFEAMTVLRGGPAKGATVAISERLYNAARDHTGWIWNGGGAREFHITNIGDFDITDIASGEDGALYVLERRFRWLEGVKMRIRRIAAGVLQPGQTLEGEILIEANMQYEIDNMEGLAVSRGRDGAVVLTVLSDDNYNRALQRTLLLQFALPVSAATKTRPSR